jgi:hypothetical protein
MASHRTTKRALRKSIGFDIQTLQRDRIVARTGAFSREALDNLLEGRDRLELAEESFIERMREQMMTAFWDAMQRAGGTVGRGVRTPVS